MKLYIETEIVQNDVSGAEAGYRWRLRKEANQKNVADVTLFEGVASSEATAIAKASRAARVYTAVTNYGVRTHDVVTG